MTPRDRLAGLLIVLALLGVGCKQQDAGEGVIMKGDSVVMCYSGNKMWMARTNSPDGYACHTEDAPQ